MCLGGRDHGRLRGVQDHAGKQAGTPNPDKRQQREGQSACQERDTKRPGEQDPPSEHLSLGVDSRHQRLLVSTSDTMTGPPDLLPGTLDLLILRTLQSTALHGWAISERIQDISENVLQINQGSLYPCLHRLEHRGWIDAQWAVSELGRRAKYYRLTTAGRKQLAVEARAWERMANAIGRVMKLA
jgi:transcriptional regulator